MADPLTFAVATIIIPGILEGIQNGLQFALDTMPEIHDARIKHAVKKFNELLLKARKGELTEKGKKVPGLWILFKLVLSPNI